MLEDSVPLTMLEAANKQFNELTSKYRDLLQKEQSLVRSICHGSEYECSTVS
jgi:centrosomal protein CEP290